MALKARAFGEYILVLPKEADNVSKGGILIANANDKEQTAMGTVIDVGPGRLTEDGKYLPTQLKADEVILYNKNSGTSVTMDGVKYLVMKESDALAVISE